MRKTNWLDRQTDGQSANLILSAKLISPFFYEIIIWLEMSDEMHNYTWYRLCMWSFIKIDRMVKEKKHRQTLWLPPSIQTDVKHENNISPFPLKWGGDINIYLNTILSKQELQTLLSLKILKFISNVVLFQLSIMWP